MKKAQISKNLKLHIWKWGGIFTSKKVYLAICIANQTMSGYVRYETFRAQKLVMLSIAAIFCPILTQGRGEFKSAFAIIFECYSRSSLC